jgi:hypothetical protein
LDPLYRPDVDKLDPPRFVLHPINQSWWVLHAAELPWLMT